LYCWGGGPGGGPGGGGSGAAGAGTKSAAAPATVAPWSETPEPVDAPDDKDIEDFALGDLHIVVLARDGTVYTRGSNSNGQLGVGKSVGREGVGAWTQVHLDLTPGHCVVGVDAGPRTTFILTARR
jgi:alpha-tubulin suppressor-like RCC1 family protein